MRFLKNTLPALLLFALSVPTWAQIGNAAPNFTVTDTHGHTHTLYDYLDSGKVVILDFFYTTCGPCIFYSPQVNLAYEKYGCNTATTFFLSIDYNDTNAEVLAYDNQYQIEYPSISGLNGGGNAVVGQYGITGFPTFYVIDSSRTIVQQIDPPTLQVFDYRFGQMGIQPADCTLTTDTHPLPFGGSNNTPNESLTVFPNPSAGLIQVHAPAEWQDTPMVLRVWNMEGHLVLEDPAFVSGNTVEVMPLTNGTYQVEVIQQDKKLMRTFVRQ